MKGSTIRFKKNGIYVKTFFVDGDGNVAWDTETGKIFRGKLESQGWEVVMEKTRVDMYHHLDDMWNKFCYSHLLTNSDFIILKKLIDRVGEYE